MEKDAKDRLRAFATKPMMDITDKAKTDASMAVPCRDPNLGRR
jgi:hypothetical protein